MFAASKGHTETVRLDWLKPEIIITSANRTITHSRIKTCKHLVCKMDHMGVKISLTSANRTITLRHTKTVCLLLITQKAD